MSYSQVLNKSLGVSSDQANQYEHLPNFGKGQAVVKTPDVEAVEVKGLPYCVTRHGN